MKTVTYILHSEPDRASLPVGRDKVVDLAAWKAEHQMEPDNSAPDSLPIRRRGRRPPVRRRWTAADWAELAATLAVTAACLALAARVLLL